VCCYGCVCVLYCCCVNDFVLSVVLLSVRFVAIYDGFT